MTKYIPILSALIISAAVARADLVMEQQTGESNHLQTAILKLHDDKMRLDQPAAGISVIVDLKSRNSYTLLTTNKMFLFRFGSEIRWEMSEERKYTHGTNDLDQMPVPAEDTGKSENVSGYDAEIYTWSGARGLTEKLWVAKNFPDYAAIKTELARVDQFNAAGPHPNAQPELSRLPGMVIKAESTSGGQKVTTTLVSAKVEPVDSSLFELPVGYKEWKPAKQKP